MIIYYLYPNSTIIIPSLVNHRRPLPAYPTACGCHWRAPRVWMATPAACCQWRWGNWRRPVAVGWISSGWADLWWFYYEKIGIFIICLSMKLNLTGISWEFTGQKWGLEAWVCLKTAKFRRWTFSYTSCFDVQQDKPISDISFPIKIAKNEMGGSPPPFWDTYHGDRKEGGDALMCTQHNLDDRFAARMASWLHADVFLLGCLHALRLPWTKSSMS